MFTNSSQSSENCITKLGMDAQCVTGMIVGHLLVIIICFFFVNKKINMDSFFLANM